MSTLLMPQDLQAEASVLGSILLDPKALEPVIDVLTPEDFYRENNASIYRAALNLFSNGEPIDAITMARELERLGVLERVGGRAHLGTLQEEVPTAANAEHYARIVKDLALKRQLIGAGTEVTKLGYEGSLAGVEAVDQAHAVVYAIGAEKVGSGLQPVQDLLKPALDQIDAQMTSGTGLLGIPSGFHDLDQLTGGFSQSDLVVIAGRPSMAKTSLATGVAMHAAITKNTPVAFFSLEMSKEQLIKRMLGVEARVEAHRLFRGTISPGEYQQLLVAAGPLGDAPILIDDTPMLDDLALRLKARQAKSRYRVELIVVDYLQMMHSRRSDTNRVQEVSAISRALKSIAQELRVTVLAISQLSRAPEARPDKRPILSDLRESGCLTGDTLVYLPDEGASQPMRDLVGSAGFRVLSLDTRTWHLEPKRVTNSFATGRKPVLRLTTRLGHRIDATVNHRFLSSGGWKRLDRLSCGDRVAVASRDAAGWDEVTSVEAAGEADVFDLTVDGLHNFVASGVVAHNSIEQDADVVMFLYRDEYYNGAKSEKPGIAEVIIAKHRNGPIGTVELGFRKELTRFENIDRHHVRDGGPDS
jgi:replicative DNA helicase